ncbi:uncharacterized protein LOC129093356 [Anoplopoma fimbria]|uniref:uncharacterized protein LOC129093356 n=1 Tax=Anoplopoma fimbria TaxID=229290 RepID=UPI0023ED44AC|nr:uncharacterized protein LOC129093356 [Anoplopoma fimbria]
MMTRMSPSFPLFVMSCLFLTAESHQGSISPPQNLSLLWIAPFEAQFSWEPPPHSVENCTYTGIVKTNDHKGPIRSQNISSPWQLIISMEGGFLEFSLKIDCGVNHCQTAVKNFTYPDLVKNLTCYIYGAKKSHCSWHPASQAPDLRFFYGLVNETFGHTEKLPLKECSSFPDGVRNSCDLEADIYQSIFIFFNGTVNNKVARNTFKPSNHVQPPPLNWTVVKNGDKFHISWTPPDIGVWKFTIRYTECNEQKVREMTVRYLDVCLQCLWIEAVSCLDSFSCMGIQRTQ